MSTVVSELIKIEQTNTCDLLLHYLEQLGVEYIFGIPGGAIEPLYNALAKSEQRGGIRAITARHETGAVFMADAYARNTGKLGVCCSTTGPGATNMITGIASSYENNTPLLIITPQVPQDKQGRRAFQDSGDTSTNILGMFRFCTRYNSSVTHIGQFQHKFFSAIRAAYGSPNGPVHLSIPSDVLKAKPISTIKDINTANLLRRPILKDDHAIGALLKEINNAKNIVFVVGSGSQCSVSLILKCVTQLNAKFVSTPNGKAFVNPYHSSYYGVIGFAGHKSATEILKDKSTDLVIAIGTSFGEFTSNSWDSTTLLNNKLIHIDDIDDHFSRTAMAKLHVGGDIPTILEAILAQECSSAVKRVDAHIKEVKSVIDKTMLFVQKHRDTMQLMNFSVDEPNKASNTSSPLKPQYLMSRLTKIFPINTRYIADIGNSFVWAIHYLNPYDRRINQRRTSKRIDNGRRQADAGLIQICTEFCSMGWGIGGAIGTALAHPKDPVVCIVGDGSFLMSGQEITVALQEKLNVIFLIMNDQQLGMVKHGQHLNHVADTGNKLPNISYALMGSAMGIMSNTIETANDLNNLNIDAICKRNGPTILDVRIDPNETPPMSSRLKGLT
ncbi:MAG: acetolactate synthase [Piscirickettsiaceae bacterium]|nr:MAG: acetolactate synthase [Piscirickettsiaceae bacterium]